MNRYQSEVEAIIDLHEMGFIHDFQFDGTNLLWVQGKIGIKAGDFSILECYGFADIENEGKVFAIYGILALEHNIKGILIDHFVRPLSVFCSHKTKYQTILC